MKLGGALPSLVTELQAVERRRAEIQRTLNPMAAMPTDAAKLRTMLADWRALFRDNVRIARQILRTLFTDRGDLDAEDRAGAALLRVPSGLFAR